MHSFSTCSLFYFLLASQSSTIVAKGDLLRGGKQQQQHLRQLTDETTTCYDKRPIFQYNTDEWWNGWGDKCSDFEANPNWCNHRYGTTPNMGMTAQEACCACSGGSDTPPEPLTHMDDCMDVPNFRDAGYETCDYYGEAGSTNCIVYGEWGGDESKWPSKGCCACGGGIKTDVSPAPTPGPTQPPPPTPSPTPLPTGPNYHNPIEVPAGFVPQGDPNDKSTRYCHPVDLSSITPPPNPGYRDEAIGNDVLSGDDKWATAWYAMLYANCERQARGLHAYRMWEDNLMVQWSYTFEYQQGHGGFGERETMTTGALSEAGVGGPLIGNERVEWTDGNGSGIDFINNGLWDPVEIGMLMADSALTHGGGMVATDKYCLYSATSIGSTADGFMHGIFMYGTSCDY